MSRVRTSHSPDGWRDMGPEAPMPRRGRNDPWTAHPVGDMLPLIVGTVLASYSNGHHGPETRERYKAPEKPTCGLVMKITKQVCAMPAGHKDTHRCYAAVVARAERFAKRAKAA